MHEAVCMHACTQRYGLHLVPTPSAVLPTGRDEKDGRASSFLPFPHTLEL